MELLSDILRTETARNHESLDQLSLMKALMSDAIDIETYSHVIAKMRQAFSIVESEVQFASQRNFFATYHYHPKVAFLEQDLAALQATPMALPEREFHLTHPDQAIGALYVLFGSCLGAQFISKHLEHRLQLNGDSGLAFYLSSAADRKHWPEFKNAINTDTELDQLQVVKGAQKAFDLFFAALSVELPESIKA